jgi:probable rRNA maturation factor
MKKELLVSSKHFELNFLYTDDLVTLTELDEYKENLAYLAQVFDQFIQDELSIKKDLFVLNLNIVDDAEIIEINAEYRNKKKVTDVLSFPMQENLRTGEYDSFMPEIELGDLFVCKSVCEVQAIKFKLTYMEEFLHLAAHGFLHVCGFDHEISDIEEKIMEDTEEKILLKIAKLRQEN